MTVQCQLADGSVRIIVREIESHEALGEPSRFDLLVAADEPLDTASLLGGPCTLDFSSRGGDPRRFGGVVTKVTTIANENASVRPAYRLRIESQLAVLRLRTRSRVYRDKKGHEIVAQVLREGGYVGSALRLEIVGTHFERTYTVQYAETDATFVRRICEEDGLYFYFDTEGETEVIVLADDSTGATRARPTALPIFDEEGTTDATDALESALVALDAAAVSRFRLRRRRRPGRVTLRDYDPAIPAVTLEGVARRGTPFEQSLEVYEAPGQFHDESEGKHRAELRLQSLRADAEVAHFTSTALELAPGRSIELESRVALSTASLPTELLVVSVRHRSVGGVHQRHVVDVEAIPLATPYRLPRTTKEPRLPGLDTGVITGSEGAEIHPDELGRVFVRFHWDLDGARDHTSSLPVRVAQSQTKGPQLLPRVGWEALVAFEDGDPDRPVVIGRSFNGKMRPPFSLPANKTMTVLATDSSPGAASRSLISFDDAAGRQHLLFQAPFFREIAAADKLDMQVTKDERYSVVGDQSFKTLGMETLSVGQGLFESVGSQTMMVGGAHTFSTGGNQDIRVGSETVVVVGAQLEQVGNPVKGAVQLGVSAVIEGVSSRGIAGAVVGAGLGVAKAAYDGYNAPNGGGWEGAKRAAGMAGVGIAAGLVPGGDAALAGLTGAAHPNPWDFGNPQSGSAAPGGGAGGGASDSAAAQGPGPGYRQVLASGIGVEVVAGPMAIVTPGKIGCTTLGASAVVTGASRTVRAVSVAQRIGGASLEAVGSLDIDAAEISRKSLGAGMMTASGSYEIDAVRVQSEAPRMKIKVGGTLKLEGSICMFVVPGASVCSFDGCVFLHAAKIEITGECEQSGDMTHK